ncbi:MAG: sugar ABC transporter permease [Clostridia bacterium]
MKPKRCIPLYLAPCLILILVIVLFPICYTAYISLTNMNLYHWSNYEIIGFGNYARALGKLDSGFFSALWTTLLWTAVNMALQLFLGFFIALGLNSKRLHMKRFFKTLLMFPWAMPAYVSILIWRVGMFNTEFGLLNQVLVQLGFSKLQFLSSNVPAFLSCLMLNLWMALPFMIMMFDGAFQAIDKSLYESATLDGAGFFAQHAYVTMPCVLPIMAPSAVMTTFITFKQFDIFYLLTMQKGSLTGATLQTVITYAHNNAFVSNNYGLSAAVSIVIFGLIILLSLLTNRSLQDERQGLSAPKKQPHTKEAKAC